jgi:hypothetical protein
MAGGEGTAGAGGVGGPGGAGGAGVIKSEVGLNQIFFPGTNPICANPCLGAAASWQSGAADEACAAVVLQVDLSGKCARHWRTVHCTAHYALYCTLHCTALYYKALHCTAQRLHCTVL